MSYFADWPTLCLKKKSVYLFFLDSYVMVCFFALKPADSTGVCSNKSIDF